MRGIFLLLVLSPMGILNGDTFSTGIRGGIQEIFNENGKTFNSYGVFVSIKPPLLKLGLQVSADWWRKSEFTMNFCKIETIARAFDATLVYFRSFPLFSVYGGIGGGIQLWTTKISGFECGDREETDTRPDLHGLFGTKIRHFLYPLGIVGEVKFSRVFANGRNSNDLGMTAGAYWGF